MSLTQTAFPRRITEARQLVASSSTWRSLLGVSTAGEAFSDVRTGGEEIEVLRDDDGNILLSVCPPILNVFDNDDTSMEEAGIGLFRNDGSCTLQFTVPIPSEYSDEEICNVTDARAYINEITGKIMREVLDLARKQNAVDPDTNRAHPMLEITGSDGADILDEEEVSYPDQDHETFTRFGFKKYSLRMF